MDTNLESGNQEGNIGGESNIMQASEVPEFGDDQGTGTTEVVQAEQGQVGEQNSAPKEEVLHLSFTLT